MKKRLCVCMHTSALHKRFIQIGDGTRFSLALKWNTGHNQRTRSAFNFIETQLTL